jgi:hypothetical protein
MLDAGFHPEATLQDLFHTAGRWHDVTTYAALEPPMAAHREHRRARDPRRRDHPAPGATALG